MDSSAKYRASVAEEVYSYDLQAITTERDGFPTDLSDPQLVHQVVELGRKRNAEMVDLWLEGVENGMASDRNEDADAPKLVRA